MTLKDYEKFARIREMLAKQGVTLPMPAGN